VPTVEVVLELFADTTPEGRELTVYVDNLEVELAGE